MEPDQGPVWLHITGSVDVKEFLQSEGFTPPEELLSLHPSSQQKVRNAIDNVSLKE